MDPSQLGPDGNPPEEPDDDSLDDIIHPDYRITAIVLHVRTTNENKDKRTPISFTLFNGGKPIAGLTVGAGVEWPEQSIRTIEMRVTAEGMTNRPGLLAINVDLPNCDWNARFQVTYATSGGQLLIAKLAPKHPAAVWSYEQYFTDKHRRRELPFRW